MTAAPTDEKIQWGIGLRSQFYDELCSDAIKSQALILEFLADNFLYHDGGPQWNYARLLAEKFSTVMHGVGLNIAGADPLSDKYLQRLKICCDNVKPKIVSDHLSFTRSGNFYTYDLIPFSYSNKELLRIAERVKKVQSVLNRQLSLENLSSYIVPSGSEMTEVEFFVELCDRTGCKMLLDINNLYVSAYNLKFDAFTELKKIPGKIVSQYHLSGFTNKQEFLHDTHDQFISSEVWFLYECALRTVGLFPTIIERDDSAVNLSELFGEINCGKELESRMFALVPNSRVEIYQTAYRARILTVLATTVLERVSEIFGKDFLMEALELFFEKFGTRYSNIVENLKHICEVLKPEKKFSDKAGFFDVISISVGYWFLLHGNDPSKDPSFSGDDAFKDMSKLFLRSDILFFQPETSIDLYSLWFKKNLSELKTGILLCKKNHLEVIPIEIPSVMFAFVDQIKNGENILSALENCSLNETDAEVLSDLMQNLAACHAFTNRDQYLGCS